MPRPPLSVTIVSLNEEANIARAIRSVAWADEILVIDSGSTDRTLEIARSLGAKTQSHAWAGYGQQKNFAQSQVSHDWILSLDADEEVTPELRRELESALEGAEASGIAGFSLPRKTFYLGRWIRHGGWYPNVLTRIADRRKAAWTEPQVHEELKVNGRVVELRSALNHHSFPSIESQVITNLRFSKLGSEQLARRGRVGSLPMLLLKPLGKFLETYILKAGFLDGLAGFIISINAAYSMFLKYAYLIEPRLRESHARRQLSERSSQ